MKRLLALFLVLAYLVPAGTVFAAPAVWFGVEPSADEPAVQPYRKTAATVSETLSGGGTQTNPYLISDVSDMLFFSERVNAGDETYRLAYYRQTGDICLTGSSFLPIGTEEFPFEGEYDGDGYLIEHDDFRVSGDYAGVFGRAKNASFRNINVKMNLVVTNDARTVAGGLCGEYSADINGRTAEITRCTTAGNLEVVASASAGYAGGLFGKCAASAGRILVSDCMSAMDVSATGNTTAYAGGIAAYASGDFSGIVQLRRCVAEQKVRACGVLYYAYAGGLSGWFAQSTDAWSGWVDASAAKRLTAVTESQPYNIADCVTASAIEGVSGYAPGTHIGWLCSYAQDDVKTSNSYHLRREGVVPTVKSENGTEIALRSELFEKTFLAQTGGFDFENIWLFLQSGKVALQNRLSFLDAYAEESGALSVQPVGCSAGVLFAVYRDENGRVLDVVTASYDGVSESVTYPAPETAEHAKRSVQIHLIDPVSLKPLARFSARVTLLPVKA